MNITPEMLAALPPELRLEMRRWMFALLAELGVKPLITPDGEKVIDIADLAPALGMSIDEAVTIVEEASGGVPAIDPATLATLQ